MKIAQLLAAAGLVVASLGVSTAADAQNWHGRDRHDNRNDHRGWNNNRGHHNGWDRHHQRCRVEWRHHRRVQICR